MARMKESMRHVGQSTPLVPAVKVDFEAWWAINSKKIPTQHYKEIVLADFRARGLSMKEPAQSYNEALIKYGVKPKP